jgi:hypothetical protein
VYLNEDDPPEERRATVLRDPPSDEDPATRDLREQLPGFAEDSEPGPAQTPPDADAGGHSLTEDESRWLD